MIRFRNLVTTLLGLAALAVLTAGCTGATALPSPVSPLPTAEALTPQASSPVWPTPVVIDWEPELELSGYTDHVTEQTIAFLREGNLYVVDAESGVETRLTSSANVTYLFGWSHDRTKLALGVGWYAIPESDGPVGTDLWVVDLSAGRPAKAKAVTKGLKVAWAEWSPIDDRIAYGSTDATLHLVTEEGLVVPLPICQRERAYLGTWSPDGTQLTYRSSDAYFGEMRLVLMDMMAGGTTLVLAPAGEFTVGYAFSSDITWSLDGQELLYRREPAPEGEAGLWRYRLDGDGRYHLELPETMAGLHVGVVGPRSPVADEIVVVGYGPPDIRRTAVMTFAGEVRLATEGQAVAWSPDGQALALLGRDGSIRLEWFDGNTRHLGGLEATQVRWSR